MFSPTKRKSCPRWVNPFTHILNISGVGQILLEWGRPTVLHSSLSWVWVLEARDGVLFTRVKLRPSPGPGSLQVGDGPALRETLRIPGSMAVVGTFQQMWEGLCYCCNSMLLSVVKVVRNPGSSWAEVEKTLWMGVLEFLSHPFL